MGQLPHRSGIRQRKLNERWPTMLTYTGGGPFADSMAIGRQITKLDPKVWPVSLAYQSYFAKSGGAKTRRTADSIAVLVGMRGFAPWFKVVDKGSNHIRRNWPQRVEESRTSQIAGILPELVNPSDAPKVAALLEDLAMQPPKGGVPARPLARDSRRPAGNRIVLDSGMRGTASLQGRPREPKVSPPWRCRSLGTAFSGRAGSHPAKCLSTSIGEGDRIPQGAVSPRYRLPWRVPVSRHRFFGERAVGLTPRKCLSTSIWGCARDRIPQRRPREPKVSPPMEGAGLSAPLFRRASRGSHPA